MIHDALIVMYHYIWPDAKPVPGGIRPLFASEFESQLDWLAEQYEIVTASQFLARLRGGWKGRKAPCLLTFDDGTGDHAEVATPILSRRGLSGVFFILTYPTEQNLMPATHGVHWLLGQDEHNVWQTFLTYVQGKGLGESALGNPADAKRIYYYEPELRARIKYAANMALPPEATEEIVARKAAEAGISLRDLSRQWFASADQIRQMHKSGMEIAMHGVTHRSLQILGPDRIADEIRHCSQYLTKLTGSRPNWWACPFGGSGARHRDLAAMCAALDSVGVHAAVTATKNSIRPHAEPWSLPRFDTIDLPPRKSIATPAILAGQAA